MTQRYKGSDNPSDSTLDFLGDKYTKSPDLQKGVPGIMAMAVTGENSFDCNASIMGLVTIVLDECNWILLSILCTQLQ